LNTLHSTRTPSHLHDDPERSKQRSEEPRAEDETPFQTAHAELKTSSQKKHERRCVSPMQTVKKTIPHRRLITVDACAMSAQFTVFRCQRTIVMPEESFLFSSKFARYFRLLSIADRSPQFVSKEVYGI